MYRNGMYFMPIHLVFCIPRYDTKSTYVHLQTPVESPGSTLAMARYSTATLIINLLTLISGLAG